MRKPPRKSTPEPSRKPRTPCRWPRRHRRAWVGDAFLHHLRHFFGLPDLTGKAAVGADRENLHAHLLDFWVLDGNCRQFGGSNKGEVAGVEAQDHPLAVVVRQLDVLETAIHEAAASKSGAGRPTLALMAPGGEKSRPWPGPPPGNWSRGLGLALRNYCLLVQP